MNETQDPIIVQTAEASFIANSEGMSDDGIVGMERFVSALPANGKAQIDIGWWGARAIPEEIHGPIPIKEIEKYTYSVAPRQYGSAEEWDAKTLRRDQTGQASANLGGAMSQLTRKFHDKLVTDRMLAGVAGTVALAYDDQFFFDTDHADAPSTAQSNDLTVNIADPANVTAADIETLYDDVAEVIGKLRDDQNKPLALSIRDYTCMHPPETTGVIDQVLNATGSRGGARAIEADASGVTGRWRGQAHFENPWWTEVDSVVFLREGAAPGGPVGPMVMNLEVPWHIGIWGPNDLPNLFHQQVFHSAYRADMEVLYGWWRSAIYVKFT